MESYSNMLSTLTLLFLSITAATTKTTTATATATPVSGSSFITALDLLPQVNFKLDMRKDEACKVACRVKLDAEAAKNFKEKIDGNYRVNMILGNVSVTERQVEGFPIGFKGSYYPSGKEVYFINNHLSFKVMYHVNPEDDSAQIVGFHVDPYSINHEYECPWNDENPHLLTCNQHTNGVNQAFKMPLRIETDTEVVFTYDVSFFEYDYKQPRIRRQLFPGPNIIF